MKQKVPDKIPPVEYRKILYTTDLSESGRYAFHHAASLANRYGAELTVLHIVEGGAELDRRLFGYVDEKLWEEIKTRNLQEARDILIRRKRDNAAIKECIGQFCDEVQAATPDHPALAYGIDVKIGDPVNEIIRESEAGSYDLIVMGMHGHGPVRSAMMGDTVRRVVKRSKIPVLIVRVPEEED
ncbi:MAG: universal stress protein [Nitrospiraceae bacterium]|nr:MAG: universal stress protein [Nitrospiraceae bacterium]